MLHTIWSHSALLFSLFCPAYRIAEIQPVLAKGRTVPEESQNSRKSRILQTDSDGNPETLGIRLDEPRKTKQQ